MLAAQLTSPLGLLLTWVLQNGAPQRAAPDYWLEKIVLFCVALVFFFFMAAASVALLTLFFGALAVPPVFGVQWLYRRGVLRWMNLPGGAGGTQSRPPGPETTTATPAPSELRFEVHDAGGPGGPEASPLHRRAEEASRAVTRVFVAAAVVYAAAMTPLAAHGYAFARNLPYVPKPFDPTSYYLLTFLTLLWLPLLTFTVASVGRRRRKLLFLGAYMVMIAAAATFLPVSVVLVGWVLLMAAPTSTMLVLRFSGVTAMALGTVLSLAAAALPVVLGFFTSWGTPEEASAWDVLGLVLVLASPVASALLALALLWWMGRRYVRRETSEQILLLDGFWLSATFILSSISAIDAGWYALLGAVPLALYELAVWLGLRRLGRGRGEGAELRLLLLRVFGAKRRSEWLLKRLGRHWRYAGSIQLIAAPDLAAANLELDELLDFATRRLKDRFVKDSADCARRVESLDARPDPDGRYRVHEFFCHDDVWLETVAALTRRSDAVLMDLRGFSAANRGCTSELFQLVEAVPVNRLVILVDERTDADFLRRTFAQAWAGMGAHSPNRDLVSPTLRLVNIRRQNSRALGRLLALLGEAAQVAPLPAPPVAAPAVRPQPVAV